MATWHHSVESTGKLTVRNKNREDIAGVVITSESKELVVLCHGFRSTKEDKTILKLVDAITDQGFSVVRFDFSGNGESRGEFQYGNYRKEADDLHSVIQCLASSYKIYAVLGHSKGGDVVLLYAAIYRDVPRVINVSGRFDLANGIEDRLGPNFMERIKEDGFIDVKNKSGKVEYRVTEASLMERLATDMRSVACSIDKNCRVLTVHGSADEIIPVEDALEFDKLIPNHKLHIIEGANHSHSAHQDELASVVTDFLNSTQVGESASSADA